MPKIKVRFGDCYDVDSKIHCSHLRKSGQILELQFSSGALVHPGSSESDYQTYWLTAAVASEPTAISPKQSYL